MAHTINKPETNNDSFLNAMLASILLILGLFLILMFVFTRPDKEDTPATLSTSDVTATTLDPAPPAIPRPSRLSWEESRLERLQRDYANVSAQQANVEEMNSRIENLNAEIKSLQTRIAENQIQLGQAHAATTESENQILLDKNNAQIRFENQLQQIKNEQIQLQRTPMATAVTPSATETASTMAPANSTTPMGHNPDGTMRAPSTNASINASINPTVNASINASVNPSLSVAPGPTPASAISNRMAELEAQHNQITTAMNVNELEAENKLITLRQDLQNFRAQNLAQREELRSELNDQREELKYWQSQKSQSGNEALRIERLDSLQKRINEQLGVVQKLRASR